MNADEVKRLLATVEEEEDSATLKPDDVPEFCSRKRKEVTRLEFDSLQAQVS